MPESEVERKLFIDFILRPEALPLHVQAAKDRISSHRTK